MEIALFDTTLRDGCQAHGFSLTVEDKLRVAQRLDALGFSYIEGGWPGSNPRDAEFFARAGQLAWRNARLAAFGSTRRAGIRAADDSNLQILLSAETPVTTIVGKASAEQVRVVLGVTLDENLAMIADTVSFLKDAGREVVFDAEHFFDGYMADPDYALRCLNAARSAGADWLVLCDTNGGTMPFTVGSVCRDVVALFGSCVGIHTHNDSEVAVANTLAGVAAGARQVQGTVNGYGERVGNANLCSVIPNLQLKMGYRCLPDASLERLTELSRYVSEVGNAPHSMKLPYVGADAFAHKAGYHVNAVTKSPQTYEHIAPSAVGNRRLVVLSDLSGRSNVQHKLAEMGLVETSLSGTTLGETGLLEKSLPVGGEGTSALLRAVKQREHEGMVYEDADASFELLARSVLQRRRPSFRLQRYSVMASHGGDEAGAEATVKVQVGGRTVMAAAEGNGPVHALDLALREALIEFYPHIANVHLADYKVRVVDNESGTDARVRVWIQATDGQRTWNTAGASTDIVAASAAALVDSQDYYLLTEERETEARLTG